MGSKNRHAKDLLPIILKDRKPGQWYVEPFVGGANMIDKVENPRIGNDVNKYLIALLKEMQTQVPFSPGHIGEELYQTIRKNKDNYPDWLVGYVGFNLSFAAKFFGGYRRDKAGVRDYENEAQQNLQAQQNLLADIEFHCGSYDKLLIPPNSIIYCDPPYKGTTSYKDKFDHAAFYLWCRKKVDEGHIVFVSEYDMPARGFECIWEKTVNNSLTQDTGAKTGVERLYRVLGRT